MLLLILRQRYDEDRFVGASQDPLGDASQEGIAQESLPVGPHDDHVAVLVIRDSEDHFGGIPAPDLDRRNPLYVFRPLPEFLPYGIFIILPYLIA